MDANFANDEELRWFKLALKVKHEQEINYLKYLQKQNEMNMERTLNDTQRRLAQFKSYNSN